MKELLTRSIKKVTLELIYEVVDERTSEILQEIKEIKKRQEEDFRYLNDKIDTQGNQLRSEIGQLRSEIGQLRNEIAQLRNEMSQLAQRFDQKFDTLIQLIVSIKQHDK